jgi:hypothetical protein
VEYTEDTERFKGVRTGDLGLDIYDMVSVWIARKRKKLPRCPHHKGGPPAFGCAGCIQARDGGDTLAAEALELLPETFAGLLGLESP